MLKLAGEPGIGKSALACQLGVGASQSEPGVIYALEMKGANVARRMIAAAAKVPTHPIRTGSMTEAQWMQFTDAVQVLERKPIYMSDDSNWTTAAMRADLHRLISEYGIGWAIIDYEALLKDDPEKDDNTRSKIISSRVHDMFKDLNVAGLVIDDMNKAGFSTGEKSERGKAGLSGSARKVYDADSIVFLRKNKEVPNWVNVTWEKNREGEDGLMISLARTKGYPAFLSTTSKEK